MKSKEILSLKWDEHQKNPLIYPPFPSPIIADPSFLPPPDTPDSKWHLFAHSLFGIHHFISSDGIRWKRKRKVISYKSIRPFIFKEGNKCYLFYEKILRFLPLHSQIEIIESDDLLKWSKPIVLLKPKFNWHQEGTKFGTIGNPCIIKDGNHYKLYFSCSLVYLRDCRFCEPKYIGLATSTNITGKYEFLPHPIISPSLSDSYSNLGAGAIKVIKTDDGYIGFQNSIYWNDKINHSGSAIRILVSSDGHNWKSYNNEPILKPDKGWKKSHVYALDIKKVDNKFYLYFNARNGWLIGKERIGLAYGVEME